ncbi:MAG: DUF4296 domain-containing protein [Bacteroidetes bacterium]|nr:DUF4296 domain-containing protein [Bacteroidota bacterium]
MKNTFVLVFLSISGLLLTGCSEKEEIIPNDKFVAIYLDLIKAQDTVGTSTMFVKPALEGILKKHGVTKAFYDKTVDFYMRNPKEFKEFMLEVDAEVSEMQVDTLKKQ